MGLHTHFLCVLECSINGKGELEVHSDERKYYSEANRKR